MCTLAEQCGPDFVVVADCTIDSIDALNALTFLGIDPRDGGRPSARLRVHSSRTRNLVLDTVDVLGLSDFADRFPQEMALLRGAEHGREQAEPEEILSSLTRAFTAAGCDVVDGCVTDRPLSACSADVSECSSMTIVAFTQPIVRDHEFADEWAHTVEDAVEATFLHLYPTPAGAAPARPQ